MNTSMESVWSVNRGVCVLCTVHLCHASYKNGKNVKGDLERSIYSTVQIHICLSYSGKISMLQAAAIGCAVQLSNISQYKQTRQIELDY